MTNKRQTLIETYPIDWDNEKIQAFRKQLLDWYDANKRDLPWRQTNNPYYIWVSEIMLQQTQVNTVIPYYERFIKELPTIKDLAEVEESDLMGLWQGLGYYSRVRNMQFAAQQVMADFNGEMPNTLEGLLSLKGIGPYTGGAIGSIAFNLPEPALDGNLMRIVARLFEIDRDIMQNKTKQEFTGILYQLIDPERPGDFNQALMDIGATIMTPTNYQPIDSPIKEFDQSYQNGTSHLYPVKKKKTKATEHHRIAYAIRNNQGEWLMRKHNEKELLTGLWHFPMVEVNVVMEGATSEELLEPLVNHIDGNIDTNDLKLDQSLVMNVKEGYELLPTFSQVKHVFSHRIWHVQVMPFLLNQTIDLSDEDFRWVSIEGLETLPVSTLQQKLFNSIVSDRE